VRCGDPKAAKSQVQSGGGSTARKADGHLTMVTQHYDDNQHRQHEYPFKFVADGYVVFMQCLSTPRTGRGSTAPSTRAENTVTITKPEGGLEAKPR
jgi:hypothetical protein